MSKQLRGTALLILAAMIWGVAFVAQSEGMNYVGPFTFQAVRQMLGAVILLPVILFRDRRGVESALRPKTKKEWKTLLLSGLLCGVVLFCASSLQQIGLMHTTAGKSGFLTAMYVIFVPLLGIFIGKKIGAKVIVAAIIALVGMYFLCIQGDISFGVGELLTLGAAICFAVHILLIDRFGPQVDGVRMASLQFFVCSILSIPFMFLTEQPQLSSILACWLPICYAGILSCGVAYTLQILAQKNTDPTIASITLSLESVFASISGWIILGQAMNMLEIFGAALMFAAIVLAQLPDKKKRSA